MARSSANHLAFIALSSGFVLGRIPVYLSPWLLGDFIDELGFSGSQAGFILSAELIGVAVFSLCLSAFSEKTNLKSVALFGALLAGAAHFFSSYIQDHVILTVARFIAGGGAGLALAACSIAVARGVNPEKTYSLISALLSVASTLTLFLAGYIASGFGYKGLFVLMSFTSVVVIVLLRALPEETNKICDDEKGPVAAGSPTAGLVVMLAVLIFSVADIATWTFIERIAKNLTIPTGVTATILGTCALLSIIGAISARFLGLRLGRRFPLSVGIIVAAFSVIGLYKAETTLVFAITYFWFSVSWFFVVPYILGLASAIEESGKWVATATSSMYWGMAVAPALGGVVYDSWGLNTVGAICAGVMVVSLGMMLWVDRSLLEITGTRRVEIYTQDS